jgi:hypothetical protein
VCVGGIGVALPTGNTISAKLAIGENLAPLLNDSHVFTTPARKVFLGEFISHSWYYPAGQHNNDQHDRSQPLSFYAFHIHLQSVFV